MSQTPTERETAAAVDTAAAEWVARADRGPLSENEQRALKAWAAEDPRRAGALAKAQAVSAHFDRAQALGTGFAPHRHPVARTHSRRRLLSGSIAAAVAAMVGAGGYELLSLRGRESTRKGDIRRASLSDGSAVTLNTASTIRTAFDARQRRVELIKGEALFDVAKDPSRPFVVAVGPVSVRAVGTSFTVRALDGGDVEVLVREGVVEVSQGGDVRRVAADGSAIVRAETIDTTRLPPGRAERAMAWRQGLLDLDGLTLAQAAEEYGRYTDRRIVIEDPAVGGLKVAGLFSINDPDGFARAAALSLDLKLTAAPDGLRLDASAP